MTIEVGISRYGGPGPNAVYGVMQVMADAPGRQVLELKRRFFLQFGYELEVNEAERSRTRQLLLYRAYVAYRNGGPYAALAANPYTSTHDPSRAGAIDLGARGGQVLTQAEHNFIVAQGLLLGIIWTGATFSVPEWWHFDVILSRASQIAPETITLKDTTPEPKEPEMAQTDIDNAKVAAAISLSQATDGIWIKDVLAEAGGIVAARLGKKRPFTPDLQRYALRTYALGGAHAKAQFDGWICASAEYKKIAAGTAKKKD